MACAMETPGWPWHLGCLAASLPLSLQTTNGCTFVCTFGSMHAVILHILVMSCHVYLSYRVYLVQRCLNCASRELRCALTRMSCDERRRLDRVNMNDLHRS